MSIISQKSVKTRKEHSCFGCGRKMEKGTQMEAITSTDGGSISTDYWCKVCQTYWETHMSDGDEIGFSELRGEDREGWERIRVTVETPSIPIAVSEQPAEDSPLTCGDCKSFNDGKCYQSGYLGCQEDDLLRVESSNLACDSFDYKDSCSDVEKSVS